jgi:DNA-binding NarL/FixJ family response regulator
MEKQELSANTGIQVLLYTDHPFVAAGVASVLDTAEGFELAACCDSVPATLDWLQSGRPDIVLVHLASRMSLATLGELRSASGQSRMVLWGEAIAGEFAFQAMQLGVHSILPGTTSTEGLLTTLRNVDRGVLCFERDLVETVLLQKRVPLTKREGQIVSLVAQGLKNKAIAGELGITEGTVKVYLYKLFRKLGMNDRLDMALYGLRNLFGGQAESARAPDIGQSGGPAPARFGPRTLPPQPRARPWQRVN